MNTKKDQLFVGKKKIVWYNVADGDVEFTLDDGSKDMVTEEQFEAIALPSRYDDGEVRIKKWNPAIRAIMGILLANKMKLIEKDFVTGRIDATVIENYQQAAAYLFGAKFEEFINLSEIDRVLKEKSMNEETEVVAEEVISDDGSVEEVVAPAEEVVAEEAPAEEVVAE